MTDLDDAALKNEIDQISEKIDAIMNKVDQLYPPQAKPTGQEAVKAKDEPLTPPGPPD
jgi:hypothetical protein